MAIEIMQPINLPSLWYTEQFQVLRVIWPFLPTFGMLFYNFVPLVLFYKLRERKCCCTIRDKEVITGNENNYRAHKLLLITWHNLVVVCKTDHCKKKPLHFSTCTFRSICRIGIWQLLHWLSLRVIRYSNYDS